MTRPVVDLSPEAVDAIAQRMVELMHENGSPPSRLVTAATLARELGVSVAYVYAHADELGVRRLGNGTKPRLRFDMDEARAGFGKEAGASPVVDKPPTRRRRRQSRTGVPLIPIGPNE